MKRAFSFYTYNIYIPDFLLSLYMIILSGWESSLLMKLSNGYHQRWCDICE